MEKLHPIQIRILFDLLFVKDLNYASIKPVYMEGSQFVFHMNRLIVEGLVKKRGATYKLTEIGKEYANKIDANSLEIALQAKNTAVFCAVKNENEYLLYKRQKNPFYGCYGFPTQKILWGESALETAVKGLKEETGLKAITPPQLFAIRHYLVHLENTEIVEDKFMYCFLIKNPIGDLEPNSEGDFFWVPEEKVSSAVKKPQEEFFDIFQTLKSYKSDISFKEISVVTKNF
ncbi:MAG: NUDIX domain-containing protein [Patescibacteria group bacterium]